MSKKLFNVTLDYERNNNAPGKLVEANSEEEAKQTYKQYVEMNDTNEPGNAPWELEGFFGPEEWFAAHHVDAEELPKEETEDLARWEAVQPKGVIFMDGSSLVVKDWREAGKRA